MTTLVAIQGKDWAAVGCDSRSSGDDGRFGGVRFSVGDVDGV